MVWGCDDGAWVLGRVRGRRGCPGMLSYAGELEAAESESEAAECELEGLLSHRVETPQSFGVRWGAALPAGLTYPGTLHQSC